jgi:ATPase subunit of ABC transporter with duplicated ATPase domains
VRAFVLMPFCFFVCAFVPGKSTLIKLIRGKLEATTGICRVNQHARHVLFTQHHIDQLDLTKVIAYGT